MKRTTFIIIGLIIIVLLFGFWVYSLLYGTPQKAGDMFANFGLFGGEEIEQTPLPDQVIVEQPTVDVSTEKLRQLTMRPVIGFQEFYSTSTEPRFISYAEAGTGHIYQINLSTGEEIRTSNITIPSAQMARFSPNEDWVAVRSGYTSNSDVVLLDIREPERITSISLQYRISDFNFDSNGNLIFSEETPNGTVGYRYDPETKIRSTLFTIPFLSATIHWNTEANLPIYVYPKASSRLLGYLYDVSSGSIQRMAASGSGLIAEGTSDFITYSLLEGTEYHSFILNTQTNTSSRAPVITVPEKCAYSTSNPNRAYCGHQYSTYDYQFPDNWYKGTQSFSDTIWQIELNAQSASQLVNPEKVAGRPIDMTLVTLGAEDGMLYFLNKIDKSLWVYEI